MNLLSNKAFSVVEYVMLIVIIVGAFVIMQQYIQRGSFGMWQQSGESYGFGRQFDSQKTVQCSFDEFSNQWYDHNCAESNCPGLVESCINGIIQSGACSSSYCTNLN